MADQKLSPHFMLSEMTVSEYASRAGFDNIPSQREIDELIKLCNDVLERVRAEVGRPIIVTSGYRCKAVNTGIGGSKSSQHIKGQAADFTIPKKSNRDVVLSIVAAGITFDQLIYEFGESGWVHISRSDNPRNEVLEAKLVNGKTKYSSYIA